MGEAYWSDEDVTLHLGDCRDVLPLLPECSVDAIVTDPPYELTDGKKGGTGKASLNVNSPAGRSRISTGGGGFMGRSWDATGVPFDPETWRHAYRVLKPGGHLLAFGGTRTWHRMVCAIEDAGFEIRDSIDWIYGQGFAKSRDVSKDIDKAGGNPLAYREFARAYADAVEASPLTHSEIDRLLGIKSSSCYWAREDHRGGMPPRQHWDQVKVRLGLPEDFERLYEEAVREVTGIKERGFVPGGNNIYGQFSGDNRLTAPATDAAKQWEGWGTALKPAHEPIVVARKPLAGTVAQNVLEYGTGALNIDGCRVATTDSLGGGASTKGSVSHADGWDRPWKNDPVAVAAHAARVAENVEHAEVLGRWPANIVLTHSAACEPIGLREVQSDGHHPASRGSGGLGTSGHAGQDDLTERKSGTEVVEAWACADDCPVGELDRQSGTLTSGTGAVKRASAKGGVKSASIGAESRPEGTPMLCYGDTGGASRFYPTFKYQAKAPAHERPRLEDGSEHETVKPLGLIIWLVKLITRPGGTVLDMFAGSGPIGEACIVEGFRCILIDKDPKSAELIKTRLRKPIQPVMFGFNEAS